MGDEQHQLGLAVSHREGISSMPRKCRDGRARALAPNRRILSGTALGVVVRREQTYWKPEALASPVAVIITKSLQTNPQLPPILVSVLFVLSHLLSGLSCPCSASAAAVKRTMRMTRMVRTDVIAKQCPNPSYLQQQKARNGSRRYGPSVVSNKRIRGPLGSSFLTRLAGS